MSELTEKFETDGYVIIDLDDGEVDFSQVIEDMNKINAGEDRKLNPKIYHYNEYPRLIEGWRKSSSIKGLALHQKIMLALHELYNSTPIAFSTINFTKGTEQPLHSDYFHFGSMPELMLAGVWVALEDINPDAGPLTVVPGSHKSPIILPEDLGFSEPPRSTSEVKKNYTVYEEWVTSYIAENNLELRTPKLQKGQALIWAANMLHGAFEIKNKQLTRYSQVTHYHFEECDFFYNPNFSSREKYVYRSIEDSRIN
jgi:ectoine hydroxylase-related dioxygenase (phytanoyl-CoA dioxygenase family)